MAHVMFPMPLSPFERYTYWDSQCGNAMTFFIVVESHGTPDREILEAAVAFASQRHPLCAAIVEQKGGRLRWMRAPDVWPRIYWTREPAPPAARWRPPDLLTEPGVGVCVEESSHGARLTFRFHHACCDGLGAMQWIEDVLVHYANAKVGKHEKLRVSPIDHKRLQHRAQRRHRSHRGATWWGATLRDIADFCRKSPQPLRAASTTSHSDSKYPAITAYRFSSDETRLLRRCAHAARASLNDLLVRDLFVTIATWNRASDAADDPWYRINMPASLRNRDDVATPAANITSFTFLNRRKSEICGDQYALLASVAAECRDMKHSTRSTQFLDRLAIVSALPGALRCILRMPRCLATATLSNLGDPCRRFRTRFPSEGGRLSAGNLVITNVGGVPPLRAHTHAALGVNVYNGRLRLDLQMTPGLFTPDDAESFLNSLATHLLRAAC